VGVIHYTDIAATTSSATRSASPPRNFGGAPDDAVDARGLYLGDPTPGT